MKSMKLILAALVVLTALPSAHAGRISNRQSNQEKRIQQGTESGELTKKERRKLNKEQKEIKEEKKEARADGTVTKEERKDINQMQNKASADIYRLKHNDRKQGEDKPAVNAPAAQPVAPVAQ